MLMELSTVNVLNALNLINICLNSTLQVLGKSLPNFAEIPKINYLKLTKIGLYNF